MAIKYRIYTIPTLIAFKSGFSSFVAISRLLGSLHSVKIQNLLAFCIVNHRLSAALNSLMFLIMNRQSFVIVVSSILLLTGLMFNCTHDPLTPLEDAPIMSFKNDVQPLIISNCTQSGCHGGNGHEFPLVSYTDVMNRVSAGQPHGSKLYKVIASNSLGVMPPKPNRHMTDVEIKTIYLWIAQGANDN